MDDFMKVLMLAFIALGLLLTTKQLVTANNHTKYGNAIKLRQVEALESVADDMYAFKCKFVGGC